MCTFICLFERVRVHILVSIFLPIYVLIIVFYHRWRAYIPANSHRWANIPKNAFILVFMAIVLLVVFLPRVKRAIRLVKWTCQGPLCKRILPMVHCWSSIRIKVMYTVFVVHILIYENRCNNLWTEYRFFTNILIFSNFFYKRDFENI